MLKPRMFSAFISGSKVLLSCSLGWVWNFLRAGGLEFKVHRHRWSPKMQDLEISEEGVCASVRNPLRLPGWSHAGIPGCLLDPCADKERRGGWQWGRGAHIRSQPGWWWPLQIWRRMQKWCKTVLVYIFFNVYSQVCHVLLCVKCSRLSVCFEGSWHSLSLSSEMKTFVIVTNSSRGQSREQPGNWSGYGGSLVLFR